MKVLKFGGTSVGSATNMQRVVEILQAENTHTQIGVLSAMSGVTNMLVDLHAQSKLQDVDRIEVCIQQLREKHVETIRELFKNELDAQAIITQIETFLRNLKNLVTGPRSTSLYAEIVTVGELMSTYIVSQYLKLQGVENVLLDAREFMYVKSVENPDIESVSHKLNAIMQERPSKLYITQGFVCRDQNNTISTLKRGGSDFSATIIGAAVHAQEVQIWTDINGLHNNDPRFVDETQPIEHLTYNEAAELAYFGAKILHPQTVAPVIDKNIPVYLKNTFDPEAFGTKISNEYHNRGLKAISAKDGITAIQIKSNKMLGAHGFLKTIFEVFDRYETAIDMITTSEVSISLTIDNDKNLEAIVNELSVIAEIAVEQDHSIICIVGENLIEDQESYKAFGLLNTLPVRMISYGGSNNNISLLVPSQGKQKALQFLNEQLFKLQGALV